MRGPTTWRCVAIVEQKQTLLCGLTLTNVMQNQRTMYQHMWRTLRILGVKYMVCQKMLVSS